MPWVREAYRELPTGEDAWEQGGEGERESPDVEETETYRVAPPTLLFLLGELPFITGLYERARFELDIRRLTGRVSLAWESL